MDVSGSLHHLGPPLPRLPPSWSRGTELQAAVCRGRPGRPLARSSLSSPDGAPWTCGWKSGGHDKLSFRHFREPGLAVRHRSKKLRKAPGV